MGFIRREVTSRQTEWRGCKQCRSRTRPGSIRIARRKRISRKSSSRTGRKWRSGTATRALAKQKLEDSYRSIQQLGSLLAHFEKYCGDAHKVSENGNSSRSGRREIGGIKRPTNFNRDSYINIGANNDAKFSFNIRTVETF